MKRYGDFITSEEELAFLTTIRSYVEKEVMPVRMQLDDDYAVFEKVYEGLVNSVSRNGGFLPTTAGWGSDRARQSAPYRRRYRGGTAGFPSTP